MMTSTAMQLLQLFKKELDDEDNIISIHIALYLGYFHIQRLTCTSKDFNLCLSLVHSQDPSQKKLHHVIQWLRELEVLYSLRCSNHLLNKISNAIYHKAYRIMSFEQGGDEHQLMEEKTLYELFERQFPYRFFGGSSYFYFETCHPLDLIERELEPGEMFDDVCYNVNDEGTMVTAYEPETYIGEGLDCHFEHCKEPLIKRVFYVSGSSICGKCMDTNCILKLRFCSEFYRAQNSSFEVKELKYDSNNDDESPEKWGLKSNEFWARIWYTAPYNVGELRLIGVGPRKSFMESKNTKQRSSTKSLKRKLDLE